MGRGHYKGPRGGWGGGITKEHGKGALQRGTRGGHNKGAWEGALQVGGGHNKGAWEVLQRGTRSGRNKGAQERGITKGHKKGA